MPIRFAIETEREADGRWIAEVPEIRGALAYGESRDAAVRAAMVLGLRILADLAEDGAVAAGTQGDPLPVRAAVALSLRLVADQVEQGEAPAGLLGGVFQVAA